MQHASFVFCNMGKQPKALKQTNAPQTEKGDDGLAPFGVDPKQIRTDCRKWFEDLEVRLRYFESHFGGGGETVDGDVRAPGSDAAQLVVESMQAQLKRVTMAADIAIRANHGRFQTISEEVEEKYQEVLKLYGLHKKVCESAIRISDDLKHTEKERHKQHAEWTRMLDACDAHMDELTKNLDDAKFRLGLVASATALETEKCNIISLRSKVSKLERMIQVLSKGASAVHPVNIEVCPEFRESSPAVVVRGRAAMPVSMGNLSDDIRKAQLRAISRERGTDLDQGCYTPSHSREPSVVDNKPSSTLLDLDN